MNKLIVGILTLFLISVTVTSCQGPLVPTETHHYIHIVDDTDTSVMDLIFPSAPPQYNP
jgi:hypothetical protein